MVQVVFQNIFEDVTITISMPKKLCQGVPLSDEEKGLAYQILGCYTTKEFLENCTIQQVNLMDHKKGVTRRCEA